MWLEDSSISTKSALSIATFPVEIASSQLIKPSKSATLEWPADCTNTTTTVSLISACCPSGNVFFGSAKKVENVTIEQGWPYSVKG